MGSISDRLRILGSSRASTILSRSYGSGLDPYDDACGDYSGGMPLDGMYSPKPITLRYKALARSIQGGRLRGYSRLFLLSNARHWALRQHRNLLPSWNKSIVMLIANYITKVISATTRNPRHSQHFQMNRNSSARPSSADMP